MDCDGEIIILPFNGKNESLYFRSNLVFYTGPLVIKKIVGGFIYFYSNVFKNKMTYLPLR
jgi:hypothetical protein